MKLPSVPLLVLDTETTGFVPRVHRVIEYACSVIEEGNVVREYEELFGIDEEIPPHVQVITRIRPADLEGKAPLSEKKEEILRMIPEDAIVVGQNVGFDLRMLKGEDIDLTGRPWIDTSMLASVAFPELESYSLGYASTVLGLTHEPKHRALGDVRATVELLSHCWTRLLELSDDAIAVITELAQRGPEGYRRTFGALVPSGNARPPAWLHMPSVETFAPEGNADLSCARNEAGAVELCEEPLDPTFLPDILSTLVRRKDGRRYWIAVKNLEHTVRRLDLPEGVAVLYPPQRLVDPEGVKRLLAQESFTEDELTLAIKLYLYDPKKQLDIPLHGEEYAVWNGKIAHTYDSHMRDETPPNASVLLIDHQQLLTRAEAGALPEGDTHILIDDASMLEDTATKAFGWYAHIATLRAGAAGNEELTRLTDLLQIWVEKTRGNKDLHYLSPTDLDTPEAKGLRERLAGMLELQVSHRVSAALEDMRRILDATQAKGRIAWIETMPSGDQSVHSVPHDIGSLLQTHLYDRHPTTLLIPPQSSAMHPAILPSRYPASVTPAPAHDAHALPVGFAQEWNAEEWILRVTGKSVLLAPSRKMIEDLFIRYTEEAERRGITLFCQGMSGGQSRMQAEFAAVSAPAVLIMTPWMYEGIELPPRTVDHLLIHSLPFDHPSHAVLSKRALSFRNAFMEYLLPRTTLRLFRLLRTFARHRTHDARVDLLDKRLETKEYGQRIRSYLEQFEAHDTPSKEGEQQALF